jgi:hypothetical protein
MTQKHNTFNTFRASFQWHSVSCIIFIAFALYRDQAVRARNADIEEWRRGRYEEKI